MHHARQRARSAQRVRHGRHRLVQREAADHAGELLVGGAVYHTILDLPQCGRRTALAQELQRQLQDIPGVARASINPVGPPPAITTACPVIVTPRRHQSGSKFDRRR